MQLTSPDWFPTFAVDLYLIGSLLNENDVDRRGNVSFTIDNVDASKQLVFAFHENVYKASYVQSKIIDNVDAIGTTKVSTPSTIQKIYPGFSTDGRWWSNLGVREVRRAMAPDQQYA